MLDHETRWMIELITAVRPLDGVPLSAETSAMIDIAKRINVPHWNADTIYDVVDRVLIWQDIVGALLTDFRGKQLRVGTDAVHAYVGMRVHCRPQTMDEFVQRMRDCAYQRLRREARRAG